MLRGNFFNITFPFLHGMYHSSVFFGKMIRWILHELLGRNTKTLAQLCVVHESLLTNTGVFPDSAYVLFQVNVFCLFFIGICLWRNIYFLENNKWNILFFFLCSFKIRNQVLEMFDHAYGNYMVSRKLIFIYHSCEQIILWA